MKKSVAAFLSAAVFALAAAAFAGPLEQGSADGYGAVKALELTVRALEAVAAPFAAPQAAEASPAGGSAFRYNPANGRCADAQGREGLNKTPLEEVQQTGNGECADLKGLTLSENTPMQMKGWNLRGADLRGASVFFANLVDADLRGAKMTGFRLGYARLQGRIDRFTVDAPCRKPGSEAVSCYI